jgi:hypothetical protein
LWEGTDSGFLNTNNTHSDGFEGGVETVFFKDFSLFLSFSDFFRDEREEELRGGVRKDAKSLAKRDVAGWRNQFNRLFSFNPRKVERFKGKFRERLA